MAKANTLPVYNKNGYYMLQITMGDNKVFNIASRGYKVQSWIEFEESLKLTCIPREVTKQEYDAHYAYTESETNAKKSRKSK